MSHTSGRRTNIERSRCLNQKKANIEGQIAVLKYILEALCRRELTEKGRLFVTKLIKTKNDDLSRIENEIRVGSNGNQC